MPYSCTMDQGRLTVLPSPERVYDIGSASEERLFTTCDPPFSNNCRSIGLHKFDLMCGAELVSWPRVVAAIGRTTAGEASLSHGLLVLAREADQVSGQAPSCKDRESARDAGGECLPWKVRKPTERLVLPQGFAPLREVGARLVDGPMPSEYSAANLMALGGEGLPGSGPYGPGGEDVPREPAGALREVATTFAPAPVAPTQTPAYGSHEHPDGWTASLSFSPATDPAPEIIVAAATETISSDDPSGLGPQDSTFMVWATLLVSLIAAAFYFYRYHRLRLASVDLTGAAYEARRNLSKIQGQALGAINNLQDRLTAARATAHEPQESPGDPALASAVLQLRAMLASAEAAVATLASTAVVREVMQTEVSAIRAKIDDAEQDARRGSTPVMKLAAQFRQIARDIDRVRTVTQSAAKSLATPPGSASAPKAPREV